ncbi:unnamed protein product [Lactuca saligna]|uniref:Uncharacterized protein n=1 Tax=Lactuca saligna TaxID=75948 RepID=A0AA36A0Q4_LACSI|nr:unnamed protein product [Lactuca saligna]
MGRPKLDPNLTHWRRGGRGGGKGNRGGRGGGRGEPNAKVEPEFEVKPEVEVKPEFEVKHDVVDEGDGIDISDMDIIVSSILNLRSSNYSDAEIMSVLGINESQLKEFGCLNVETNVQEETQTVQVNEEEINEEEVNDEDMQEIMRSNTQQIRRRKPSEWITELKLKKQVVSNFGMTKSTPLNVE